MKYGPCVGPNDTCYWGYGVNGTFYKLGTRAFTPGQTHVFEIYYYQGYYYYCVDTTNVGHYYWNWWFNAVSPGPESYNPSVAIGPFEDSTLMYTTSGGSWTNWSGEDASGVDIGMCGNWVSPTDWKAGEVPGGGGGGC